MAKELIDYFRSEANDLTAQMTEELLQLEKTPSREPLSRLLRHAHTLKGAARIVGQAEVAELLHQFEEVLEPFRSSDSAPGSSQITNLLNIIDKVCIQLDGLHHKSTPQVPESPVAPLGGWSNSIDEVESLMETLFSSFTEVSSLRRHLDEFERQKTLFELLISQLQTQSAFSVTRGLAEDLFQQSKRLERRLVGGIEQLERDLQQVREGTERLRLARFDSILPLLRRAVRDSAVRADRKVEFRMTGGEIRLEHRLLTSLQNALVQAISNSVVHGIETAAERHQKGKSLYGNITLEIQRVGKDITFTYRDDGCGFDLAKARKVLQKQGYTPQSWSDSTVLETMMTSGVSMAQELTLSAGRGLGLGLIQETALSLGGNVKLRSEPGVFTELQFQLPWSLAVLEFLEVQTGLSPQTGLHKVLIPLESVRSTVRLQELPRSQSSHSETVIYEGASLRLVSLGSVLAQTEAEEKIALILKVEDSLVAATVASLSGVQTASLMPLPHWVQSIPLVAGAVLDSDGNPQLVLNVDGLLQAPSARSRVSELTVAPPRRLLVIDDSLTTRTLQESILTSAGYSVDLASSGEEGLEMLQHGPYSLILVDVEMPGIDGFTFVRRLRESPVPDLPAVLVTSRDSLEDKAEADRVGVQGYIVKSEYTPRKLLNLVEEILQKSSGEMS